MTIMVFGRTGQVATELQRLADVVALGRDEADLSNPAGCAAAIRSHAPRAVINAAAYTAVDRAEEEEALATVINGAAPAAMATTCTALDTPFVHISTDYVFAGGGTRAWRPEDPAVPQNAYGRSKLAGEDGVRKAAGRFAILRTSWVFSAQGSNFVRTMLRVSARRKRLDVVSDQIGGPTPARAIAAACLTIAGHLARDPAKSGTYHFSGRPEVSWHGFAKEIFAQARRPVAVTPIASTDYPTPAKRPLNSRLNCQRTAQVFGLASPDWREALTDILRELDQRK